MPPNLVTYLLYSCRAIQFQRTTKKDSLQIETECNLTTLYYVYSQYFIQFHSISVLFCLASFYGYNFLPKSVYKEGHCMSVKIHKFLLLLQPILLADLPIHLSNIFLSMKRFQQIFTEVERKSNYLGGMKESSDVCLSFELFHFTY